jgi:hypothetical protein
MSVLSEVPFKNTTICGWGEFFMMGCWCFREMIGAHYILVYMVEV